MHAANDITDRKNMTKKTFLICCSDCLSAVVGVVEWKTKESKMKASDIATPSDEAFCLVTLENNYERWMAVAKKQKRFDETINQSDDQPTEKNKELWPSPKCTKQKGKNGKAHEGWSKEGMDSHNNHCHSISKSRGEDVDESVITGVEQDHVDNNESMEEWHMNEKKKGTQKKRKRKADAFEPPKLAGENEANIKF